MSDMDTTTNEERECWDCGAPLADDDLECCKRCAGIATESDVKPEITDARREALEASAALEAAEAAYNALDRRCQDLRYYADSAEDWQAYGAACRQRAEAHERVEACYDRWQAARQVA